MDGRDDSGPFSNGERQVTLISETSHLNRVLLATRIEILAMSRCSLSTYSLYGVLVTTLLVLSTPVMAWAGMPAPLPEDIETILRLREEPKQRLQVISFFLLILVISALFVKWLWNGLRQEFPKLPRISYGKSLLLTTAWGLLFCIVLVMISGARELMTPGAWKKEGATYQLNQSPSAERQADQP